MDSLPEELQLRILEYLDSAPPSEGKIRHEPTLALARSKQHPLKDVASLSKHWRRLALPLLLRHAHLQIDQPVQPHWRACCLHDEQTLDQEASQLRGMSMETDAYHREMVQDQQRLSTASSHPIPQNLSRPQTLEDKYEYETRNWALRIYHATRDFINFVQTHDLGSRIASLVLSCDHMRLDEQVRRGLDSDHRYTASAALWLYLFSVMDPGRIVIVSPPFELGLLCNVYINMDAGLDPTIAWAFTDMEYHILELQQAVSRPRAGLSPLPEKLLSELDSIPTSAMFTPSSILNQRMWTSISLNEGSFLQAYGTYEYFERGPPSLVPSIAMEVEETSILARVGQADHLSFGSIRSFTYTAIFPFSNHLDFLGLLRQLEILDLQFAPDPQSGILDDRERTGKAELQDCWQELISAYHDVATTISTFRMTREEFPNLKTFICRDMSIPALKDDLDHIFTPLCLPVWAEYEVGVFSRIADKAVLPGADDII